MKKIFSILAIALVAAFAEPEGKLVDVELLSGTQQRAKLIGIENDTVSLGGYIQNKFTIVKIAKGQFKKIVDEQGNDLLNADNTQGTSTKKAPAAKEPVTTATSSSTVATSSAVKEATAKTQASSSATATSSASKESAIKKAASSSSIVESSSSQPSSSTDSSTPNADKPKPEIKTVLIAYNAEGIEQNIADQITALTARLLMESGEKPQIIRKTDIPNCNDNICIQSALASHGFNSIYFGEIAQNTRTDSLSINLTHVLYEDSLPLLHRSSFNVSRESALGDAITNNKLKNQLLDAQGKDIVKSKKDRAYIHVETDPDGATISRTNKDAICKSPCTFITTDTSKFTIHAYWNVDRHLWGASSSVVPLIGDTTFISLKLKRVTPEIRIQTFPEGANVYKAHAPITKRSKAIAQTPEKIPVYEMGMDSLIIRKAGYRDTLVSFFVAPVSQIDLSIDLQKLTDFDEIEQQNKWLHDKKMQTLGEAFIGGSIGTALIGGLFMYLAHLDYNDADDIKKELRIPGAVKGENYKNKVDKNHKLVKQGDNKAIAGGILLGTAAALLGVGIYFVF
ncbi:MAG: hypothetical protein J6W51_01465 [Fibrobacter sp.]|nr:hypothetical protein [Fibrobacter sp.]